MMNLKPWFSLILICLLSFESAGSADKEVKVAVATNFTAPMKILAKEFEKTTGYKAILSFASSGKLYAQIHHGAPFEVFLSADAEKPLRLADEGLALPSSHFTYALGALALWSSKAVKPEITSAMLQSGNFNKLAIANPKLAPYGIAALQVLESLNLTAEVKSKLVKGENIAQAYQYVSSGNAELGFVALTQMLQSRQVPAGSFWVVPKELYKPIHQDAILLQKGKANPAANALLSFMQSDKAAQIIQQFGYEIALQ